MSQNTISGKTKNCTITVHKQLIQERFLYVEIPAIENGEIHLVKSQLFSTKLDKSNKNKEVRNGTYDRLLEIVKNNDLCKEGVINGDIKIECDSVMWCKSKNRKYYKTASIYFGKSYDDLKSVGVKDVKEEAFNNSLKIDVD